MPPLLLLVAFRFVAKLLFFLVYLIMRQASSTCCCCCCCCLRLGLHISYFIVIATEWFTLSLFLRPRIGTLRSLRWLKCFACGFCCLPAPVCCCPRPLRRDPSLRQETATVRGRAQVKHSTYSNVIVVVFVFVVIGNSVAGVLKRISCLLQVFFAY